MKHGAKPWNATGVEIVQARRENIDSVVPLFDAYLQFYKLPSNEEAARGEFLLVTRH